MPWGKVPKRTSGSAGRSLFACGQGSAAGAWAWICAARASEAASAKARRRSIMGAVFREKAKADQAFLATWKPAKLWLTGISSIALMLRWGGRFATQWMVSAMSLAGSGGTPGQGGG